MTDFLTIATIGGFLILLTSAIMYESLAVVWQWLPKIKHERLRIIFMMVAIFICHIVCIWVYGAAFYVLANYGHTGAFIETVDGKGAQVTDLWSNISYATALYTSLGLSNAVPAGGFKLLSGIACLNGMVLIGWTASFAFLCMQLYWKLHEKPGKISGKKR